LIFRYCKSTRETGKRSEWRCCSSRWASKNFDFVRFERCRISETWTFN